MYLLNKLTIKNLKLNEKRTIVTIIGIMLSVALITAVATMYSSAIKSLKNFETYHKGNFHIVFYDVNENEIYKIEKNKGVEELYLTNNIGYAKLNDSKNEYKPYVYIKGFTSEALENLSIRLIDGRLPKDENEIVMPSHLKNNGRVNLKIDDVVILDVGKRINEEQAELKQYNPFNKDIEENIVETTTKTYKIIGIIERPATNIENYEAPGYTFITYWDKEINKITKCIEQINRRNYKLELDDMSEDELSILKNEVYKTTIMLKESAENSNKEKLELKDSLSDISHQLKTPITSILIILDNLIEDPKMDKDTREDFIRDIKREINSINFLVQSILILSKLDTNTINFIEEEVELKKLVNYAIKNVSMLSDLKNVNVNLRVESNSVIKCDFK